MARYLLRFDDICSTINWDVWYQIEAILDKYSIQPIMAIVPDNQDEKLRYATANDDFWATVRSWQAKGWSIGMHGYQHVLNYSKSSLLKISNLSEFAGQDSNVQRIKLRSAQSILNKNGIFPKVFVAPAHSFDHNTIRIVKEVGIDIISDGMHIWPYRDQFDILHIPQQLWRFRKMPFGVWTVCFHHNTWGEKELTEFEHNLSLFHNDIINLDKLLNNHEYQQKRIIETILEKVAISLINTRKYIKKNLKVPFR